MRDEFLPSPVLLSPCGYMVAHIREALEDVVVDDGDVTPEQVSQVTGYLELGCNHVRGTVREHQSLLAGD